MKRVNISLIIMIFLLYSLPAQANITTGSWFMDRSESLTDGINYGRVDITADNETGKVFFTVTPFNVYSGLLDNYGIQRFGFNYNNITSDPGDWTWNQPGWAIKTQQNISAFGVFQVMLAGNGHDRQNPLNFDIYLPTVSEAIASNFAVPSTGTAGETNTCFTAHITDFSVTASAVTSHYVGGCKPITVPVPSAFLLGILSIGLIPWNRLCKTP